MRVYECPYVQAAGSVDGVKTPSDAQILQPDLQPAREFGDGLRCVALTLCQARKRRTRRTRNSAPPASGRTPSSRPRSPETLLRSGLKASLWGDAVCDRPVVAGNGWRGVVDFADEQVQGAGDARCAGGFEGDGDRGGGVGDEIGR